MVESGAGLGLFPHQVHPESSHGPANVRKRYSTQSRRAPFLREARLGAKLVQSPIHVEEPARLVGRLDRRASYDLDEPVDRGPFTWDRTKDGKLDEEDEPTKGRAYPRNEWSIKIASWIDALPPGELFNRPMAQNAVGQGIDIKRFKYTFDWLVIERIKAGKIERYAHGQYRVR